MMTLPFSKQIFTPIRIITLLIILIVISLNFLDSSHHALLTTSPNIFTQHQYWRWLSCNFVHYGWAHSLIDILGFLIFTLLLLDRISTTKFLCLLFFCSMAVGVFMSILSPILYYAGLSGVIHGLIIAGCFYAHHHPIWKRIIVLVITAGKILQEQLPGYDINPINNVMPVVIAIDSHLIGAIAGFLFILLDKFFSHIRRSYSSH